jgi:VanZ family protein
MLFIFALSSQHHLPSLMGLSLDLISVIGHFTVYIVLAVLLWSALPCLGWSAWRRLSLAFVGSMVFALSDEWHQSFVLGREPTTFDLAIDAVGALCALAVIVLVARTRGSFVEDQSRRKRASLLDPQAGTRVQTVRRMSGHWTRTE